MASFGGLAPYPRSLGGGNELLPALVESISSARGSHISQDPSSNVWVENNACARQIAGIWATNARLGNIWNAHKCPIPVLERWERMLVLVRENDDTEISRRERLARKFALRGRSPDLGLIFEEVQRSIGPMFIEMNTISLSNALQHVPTGSWPWGTNIPETNWSSTTFHLLIRVQNLPGQPEGAFYATMGALVQSLDPILPSWMTFDWYRQPVDYPPINVVGGPSVGGFYLDDTYNLNNSVFDT
jgi:hypothetical protein